MSPAKDINACPISKLGPDVAEIVTIIYNSDNGNYVFVLQQAVAKIRIFDPTGGTA